MSRVDDDALGEADKRRFLEDVKDNFWVKRDNGEMLARIKAELDEIDGIPPVKTDEGTSEGEEEDTEVDEEIEVIKRS